MLRHIPTFLFLNMVTKGYQIMLELDFDNLYKDLICIIGMRWGVLILLGVFCVSFASATIPGDCQNSMIAFWQFEGNVLDSYGSHDGGVWTGSSSYSALHVGSSAASFSGGGKITIPNAVDLDLDSAFTIEFWMREDESSSATFFQKGDYKMEFVDGGDIVFNADTTEVNYSGIVEFDNYHIALVWDSSGSELRLYVNGIEKDSASLGSAANAAGDLIIGDGFTGLIDELAIYDDDLSGSLINSHYLLGSAGKDYCDESGADGSSSTKAVFNIQGCNFDIGDDETFGVAKGRCSGLPHDGEYFCSEDQEGFETKDEGLGCAMGDEDFVSGNDYCCPPGFFCNGTDGLFQCARRTENCFEQMTKDNCERDDLRCIWLEVEGICSDGLRDYDCGYYDNGVDSDVIAKKACEDDIWNLGQVGIGTELCGTTFQCMVNNVMQTFSVPEGDCACAWYDNAPAGKRCQVKLVGVQMFYEGIPDKFWCSNVYTLGNCTDGEQTVDWTSTNQIISGFIAGQVPGECLAELNCAGGETSRFCGEPIIKLPGFSLFAFFASLFIVGMYYIKKEERFK